MVRIITFPPNWVKAKKAIAVTEATTVTEATSVTEATTEIATATALTATTQATTEELATEMATTATTANITKGSVVLPFGMDAESLIFVAAILLINAAATIGFGLIVRQFHRLIRSSTGIQNMF